MKFAGDPAPSPDAHPLDRVPAVALLVGAVGIGVWLFGTLLHPAAGFRSYLAAFLFAAGFSVAGLGLTMLHHLVGGAWGVVIRRPLESAAANLPIVALLFMPVAVGMFLGYLYPWCWKAGFPTTNPIPEEILHHLHAKQGKWLNPGFWTTRSVVYLVLWTGLGQLFSRYSRAQDATTDQTISRRLKGLAGICTVLLFVTVCLAAVDWAMSLEPNWASSIYGPMIYIGWGLETFAASIALTVYLIRSGRHPRLAEVATVGRIQDLGNLMLAFTMLWAYFSFSQFLIIWAGDLREEIPWYTRRLRGGWEWFGLFLMVFHFFGPFLALIVQATKRTPRLLATLAVAVVAVHYVDIYWLIIPSGYWPSPIADPGIGWVILRHWMAPFALVGVGGIWAFGYVLQLRARGDVIVNDPSVALAAHEDQTSHTHGYC